MEYYFIGERELYHAFRLVGVPGAVANKKDDALDAFLLMTGQSSKVSGPAEKDRPKVLILTEDVADMLETQVVAWQKTGKTPLIVEVPGLQGHLPGRKNLTDSIREALGIQV